MPETSAAWRDRLPAGLAVDVRLREHVTIDGVTPENHGEIRMILEDAGYRHDGDLPSGEGDGRAWLMLGSKEVDE